MSADRYQILGQIAAGGMASIHLARMRGSVGFERTVAIKRLHERFAEDPEFVNMLLDEGRMASHVTHPNVVATLDVVHEGSLLFLVMEYVAGLSLLAYMQRVSAVGERIPPPIAAAIAVGALHGLHAAHDACTAQGTPLGIVHRDISPQNILLAADGLPRVVDFGIAKAQGRSTRTTQGQVKGKLSYMAPEQVRATELDRRVDVWAMGVVLWEMLTGRKMLHGDRQAVLTGLLVSPQSTPRSLVPSLSPALDAVVMRALARKRDQRFSTAREMADALERAERPATTSEVGAWAQRVAGEELALCTQRLNELSRNASRPPPPVAPAWAAPQPDWAPQEEDTQTEPKPEIDEAFTIPMSHGTPFTPPPPNAHPAIPHTPQPNAHPAIPHTPQPNAHLAIPRTPPPNAHLAIPRTPPPNAHLAIPRTPHLSIPRTPPPSASFAPPFEQEPATTPHPATPRTATMSVWSRHGKLLAAISVILLLGALAAVVAFR